jgi:hypothetical protein
MSYRQIVIVLSSTLALSACGGGSGGTKTVPNSQGLSPQKSIVRVNIPAAEKRAPDYDRSSTDATGQVQKGFKVRSMHRTYWFPPEARFSTAGESLIVVAYHNILAFPLHVARLKNNEAASDTDLSSLPAETNPVVKIYAQNRVKKTTAANAQSALYSIYGRRRLVRRLDLELRLP